MNILTDTLPESVDISGVMYQINTDFRTCLKTIMAFEDAELTPQEKAHILLSNIYSVLPGDIDQAFVQANLFLNGGKVGAEDDEPGPRVYSFGKDADMIFAGFKQVHQIDLENEEMHWWKFIALFMAVTANQDTPFGALVTLRRRIKTGKATKEERQAAREMGDLIEVPEIDDRTLAEKEAEAEFLRQIGK